MPEPESYGPEGGHMGITGCHQTAIDLEDTAARMRRYETAMREALAQTNSRIGQPGDYGVKLDRAEKMEAILCQALNPD